MTAQALIELISHILIAAIVLSVFVVLVIIAWAVWGE